MMFYGKTFTEKQRDRKGASYDADMRKLRAENAKLRAALEAETERCAQIAEHLNGWGNKATRASGLAEHIAKIIRETAALNEETK